MTPRHFAAYFDVVAPREMGGPPDDWTQRWQYIMMPRLAGAAYNVLFHRHQVSATHRAVWGAARYNMPESMYVSYLEQADRAGNVARPPIVVELSQEELEKYLTGGKYMTPWKVIERAHRAAKTAGWRIQ